MTDNRMLANQLLADGFNDAASAHALLAIADLLDALPGRMLGHIDPTPTPVIPAGTYSGPPATVGIGSPAGEPYHFTVYEEIRQERQAQYAQGWSFEHDQQHGLAHLYEQINSWLLKPGDHPHYGERERLIVVAALAVAAVDQIDGKPSV